MFKRETGYTLREYLLNTRINAARFYLRTTHLSLKEIAYRCGYGSDSTFCTTFKRITGMDAVGNTEISAERMRTQRRNGFPLLLCVRYLTVF